MRIGRAILIVACFIVAGVGALVPAQDTAPVGTWKLNLAKSKYNPGPAPQTAILKIEAAGMGATTTVDAVSADGTTQHWAFTGNYDGKDVPITGNNPNADAAARKRVNSTTTETTYKKGGKITTVNTSVLSADGKTLTISVKGTDAQGRTVNNVQVYDRDEPEQAAFGTWRVTGSICPTDCAMSPGQAAAWRGRTATYRDSLARFADDSCQNPLYGAGHWPADGRYGGARLWQFGVTDASVLVIEVQCATQRRVGSDPRWQVPGAFLIVKDRDHLLTVWDGVFFELTRQ